MAENEPPEPLDYYRAQSPPAHGTDTLTLSFFGGSVVGVAGMAMVGLVCVGALWGPQDSKTPARLVAVSWGVVAIACAVVTVRYVRRGRGLPIEQRSRAGRFFVLGLLVGGGVAALIEGTCFGAIGS